MCTSKSNKKNVEQSTTTPEIWKADAPFCPKFINDGFERTHEGEHLLNHLYFHLEYIECMALSASAVNRFIQFLGQVAQINHRSEESKTEKQWAKEHDMISTKIFWKLMLHKFYHILRPENQNCIPEKEHASRHFKNRLLVVTPFKLPLV